jgi:hypothetical protein
VATATPVMTREPTAKPTPVPWKSYTSKTYHYKISYPPTWIVTPGPSGSADQFDQYTYPYVWIYRDASGSFASPKLTASRDIAYDKSHYAAKVITNRAIKVNGWSGRIVTLGGMWHGRKVQIVDLVVAKGRIGYGLEIFGNADTAAADLATFKRMYSSWRPT